MIGKPIETYQDFVNYVASDRWYLSMTRINEFKKKSPERYKEYRQRLMNEKMKAKSLGYRVEMKD